MYIKVKDHSDRLVRDTKSMAILNVDKTAIQKHDIHMSAVKKEKDLENTINNLQSEVTSIKSTLEKVLELLNSNNRGS